MRTASPNERWRRRWRLSSREVKSTGEKARVVILPSAVMAKVAATKGCLGLRLTMWEGPLRPDGLVLAGVDSFEPEGRYRFTRPPTLFASTESRPTSWQTGAQRTLPLYSISVISCSSVSTSLRISLSFT